MSETMTKTIKQKGGWGWGYCYSTHLVVFQIDIAYKEDTSFCIYWNILTHQVSLVALGSKFEEGRANIVFQHRPGTADGCTS